MGDAHLQTLWVVQLDCFRSCQACGEDLVPRSAGLLRHDQAAAEQVSTMKETGQAPPTSLVYSTPGLVLWPLGPHIHHVLDTPPRRSAIWAPRTTPKKTLDDYILLGHAASTGDIISVKHVLGDKPRLLPLSWAAGAPCHIFIT